MEWNEIKLMGDLVGVLKFKYKVYGCQLILMFDIYIFYFKSNLLEFPPN